MKRIEKDFFFLFLFLLLLVAGPLIILASCVNVYDHRKFFMFGKCPLSIWYERTFENKKYPCARWRRRSVDLPSFSCSCRQPYRLTHYPMNTHINLFNMRLFFHVFRSVGRHRRRSFVWSFGRPSVRPFILSFHAILFLRVFVLRRFIRISIKFQFYNVNMDIGYACIRGKSSIANYRVCCVCEVHHLYK